MTKVIFMGDLYYGDLRPDQGLPGPQPPTGQPPGYWGGVAPPHPDQGLPGQPPGYWGGVAPPTVGNPIAPGGQPPGYWGGVAPPYPSHPIAPGGQPPGFWGGVAPPHPDQGLPPGGQPVPPEVWPQPPVPPLPPELESQLIIAVHKPGAEEWEIKSYSVGPDQGLPGVNPTPPQPTPTPPTPTPHQQSRPSLRR
jgi:hypothetical protein